MSYVLASGCSYTDDDFRQWKKNEDFSYDDPDSMVHHTNWIKWPHLFAKHVNLPCVNVAKSGGDNPGMINDIFDYIAFKNKKPEFICILLSEWIRQSFIGMSFPIHTGFRQHILEKTLEGNYTSVYNNWWRETDYDYYKRHLRDLKHGWRALFHRSRDQMCFEILCGAYTKHEDIVYTEKKEYVRFFQRIHSETFRKLLHLVHYCKQNNIKLIIAQGLGIEMIQYMMHHVSKWLDKEGYSEVHPDLKVSLKYLQGTWWDCKQHTEADLFWNNPYFGLLEEERHADNINFIGWPWLPSIGGYTLCQRSVNKEWTEEKIIENDGHPNEAGQKYLADYFIKEYEKMK